VTSATPALPANTAIILGAVLWSEAPSHQGHPERDDDDQRRSPFWTTRIVNVLDAGIEHESSECAVIS
jgi:hypothetical protein